MNMKSKVIRCTVLLAIVLATTSANQFGFKKTFEQKNQRELLEFLELYVYGNDTIRQELRAVYEERKGMLARFTVRNQKLKFAYHVIEHLIEMSAYERKALIQTTKMLTEIENLQASTMNNKLGRRQLDETQSNLEDLRDMGLIEHFTNEYETLLTELEWLHLNVSDWRCKLAKEVVSANVLISSILNKFLPLVAQEKIAVKLNHKMLEGFEICDMGDELDVILNNDDMGENPREAVILKKIFSMTEKQEDESTLLNNEL